MALIMGNWGYFTPTSGVMGYTIGHPKRKRFVFHLSSAGIQQGAGGRRGIRTGARCLSEDVLYPRSLYVPGRKLGSKVSIYPYIYIYMGYNPKK